jgi:uroporphyrinogen-III synthase
MRLLVTRPEPDASRTADALTRLGHAVIASPLFTFRFYADRPLPKRRFQAVLVTSANAVRALEAHPEHGLIKAVPLLAVGDATALKARRAGFSQARSAGGAADDLIRLIGETCEPAAGPLLYVAGEARAAGIEARLSEAGFNVQTVVLYAMDQARLSGEALRALRDDALDGVLVYSQRAAAALALALRAEGLVPLPPRLSLFCLSDSVARPLRALAAGPVVVAAAPDQISLFAAIQAAEEAGRSTPLATKP